MRKLDGLKPEKVFRYFEDLCSIPHGSGNEEAISRYCMDFAEERGLQAYRDESNNVIITKEASAGYENAPGVILQGHLDMVCEKEADCSIDFLKDGLELAAEGDFVYAKGTTLGGDDGIAVAIALAILDDDSLQHPRLECLFTTQEETGLLGADELDASRLTGRFLINIDSEQEGVFTVSCAGGMESQCTLPLEYRETEGILYRITLDGLLGGHSGTEIHKEHGNSNLLMGRFLCSLSEALDFRIGHVSGGLMDNAIPRSTRAEIYVREEDAPLLEEQISRMNHVFQKEYASCDPGIRLGFEKEGYRKGQALTPKSASLFLFLLHMVPNGVIRNSTDIPGLVQTSLNLGILKMEEDAARLTFSVRSSVESERDELGSRLCHCVEFLGGSYSQKGVYPAWEYRQESRLRDTMVKVFERMYQKEPQVVAIHAGLECGMFSGKIEGLDCVSIGPNLYDIHTPKERLSISSAGRIYEFILEVLKELKDA